MSKDVCFVYNGYTDLRLPFDGRVFSIPYRQTTRMEDLYCWAPDEYRRNHESDPRPEAILERTYPARQVAEMLLSRHGQNLVADGCVWIGEQEPTAAEKKRCEEMGRIRKAKQVEEAMAERASARTRGGRPELDSEIVLWMKELDITDEIYNPKPVVDQGARIADLLQQIATAQQTAQKPELAGAKK